MRSSSIAWRARGACAIRWWRRTTSSAPSTPSPITRALRCFRCSRRGSRPSASATACAASSSATPRAPRPPPISSARSARLPAAAAPPSMCSALSCSSPACRWWTSRSIARTAPSCRSRSSACGRSARPRPRCTGPRRCASARGRKASAPISAMARKPSCWRRRAARPGWLRIPAAAAITCRATKPRSRAHCARMRRSSRQTRWWRTPWTPKSWPSRACCR